MRFGEEIEFEKNSQIEGLSQVKIPSMVIQPLIENAFQHGIRNIEWQGKIVLEIVQDDKNVYIRIIDNGRGIEKDKLEELVTGNVVSLSTGIGVKNVMSRLSIYFERDNVLQITSKGLDMGSQAEIVIPYWK